MSRSTCTVGLTDEALIFLQQNVQLTEECICSECGNTHGKDMIKQKRNTDEGKNAGMFYDGPDLYEYLLKDGTWIREVVQCSPWNSGPMIFLNLRTDKGENLFKWSEEDIQKML